MFMPRAAVFMTAIVYTGCAPVAMQATATTINTSSYLESVGFYQRQESGPGIFISRVEIDAQRPAKVSDLLRGRSGVRLVQVGSDTEVVASRPQHGYSDSCLPSLYIDGTPHGSGKLNLIVPPHQIEGIEVYLRSVTPSKFSSNCGSIVIWTRR